MPALWVFTPAEDLVANHFRAWTMKSKTCFDCDLRLPGPRPSNPFPKPEARCTGWFSSVTLCDHANQWAMFGQNHSGSRNVRRAGFPQSLISDHRLEVNG